MVSEKAAHAILVQLCRKFFFISLGMWSFYMSVTSIAVALCFALVFGIGFIVQCIWILMLILILHFCVSVQSSGLSVKLRMERPRLKTLSDLSSNFGPFTISARLRPSRAPKHMHGEGRGGSCTLLTKLFQNWKWGEPARDGSTKGTSLL